MAETVKDALILWGEKLVIDMKASIKKALKWKSQTVSDLEDSVKYEVNDEGTRFKLTMNDYWQYVDKGRGATRGGGTGQVKKSLESWFDKPTINARKTMLEITQKYYDKNGIKRKAKALPYDKAKKSLAFIVARKIHKEGFEARPFYDNVVTDERISELKKEIAKTVKEQIIFEIKK